MRERERERERSACIDLREFAGKGDTKGVRRGMKPERMRSTKSKTSQPVQCHFPPIRSNTMLFLCFERRP